MNGLTLPIPFTERRIDLATTGLLALVAAQLGHLFEHGVQLFQLYGLHLGKAESHGIVGALDVEWVHFVWNLLVFSATAVLLTRFRKNAWLWITAFFALWHQIEHTYLIALYLTTGVEGAPGLLAKGGVIAGGLNIPRPVLHFIYNLLEIVPLGIALLVELRKSPRYTPPPKVRDVEPAVA